MHGSLHNKQRTTPSAINYATVDGPNCWSHSISHRSQNQILVENHNFCPFHLHLMPPLWKFLPKYCHNVWHGKMRMVWLPDGKKILKIHLLVLTEYMNLASVIVISCPRQNWMVAYLGYTLRMKTLFRGWPVMAHETHTRRRKQNTRI